ncbi:putative alpha/beta-hydrolase family hydrolase [Variovorax boronicumulans]|uniref:alpha/beta hydrolase family protein n=1 Tax=Variovorax boronicumulans TaxID=436515 RepID=UPI002780CAE9|nr:alpha/beta family hydrolase [Variovorax boronicumulans]MDQ0032488.1 putative alpha/beta-hydrolase family hydrolase [Variovorax boronicumulans]
MKTMQIAISVASGVDVSALAVAPADAQACLVLAHGAGAGMAHPFMNAVAAGLAERRIATLRYQFPYMEKGLKRVDSPVLAHATVRAAVRCASQHFDGVRLFAGGKSFGGRMTSQAQALDAMPGVEGLVFLGFPLHPSGAPSVDRAAHLYEVEVPMLFVHGTRDKLAEPEQMRPVLRGLGSLATLMEIEDADHSFSVPKRSGRSNEDALDEALDGQALWTQAWRIG